MTGKVRTPDWLETDWILGHFCKQRKRAVTRYIEFVAQGRGLDGNGVGRKNPTGNSRSVSYTHLTLPTNREV